ncbi:hypothetical protein [Aquimarina algiphila]|uniref:hypothetical protein n=1 Tax=Aquimarina algiphila TaxID=2047982 RepID=UPI00232A9520|nr:hypothetical protein [Aquimarina algiphila]
MSEELFENLTLIASILLLAPLVVSIFKFRVFNYLQKRLFSLVILTCLVEIVSWILWYKKINNLPVYHFYTIIEFLLIVNIYKNELNKVFAKHFFVFLSICFTVFAIINTLFFQSLKTFNSNVTTVMGLIVIFFALSYFYALLKEVKYRTLESNPMFWINSGFLIYFSSNLILFYMNNTLFKGVTEASLILWGLHAIVNIVLTIFYTIALWVNPKKQNT